MDSQYSPIQIDVELNQSRNNDNLNEAVIREQVASSMITVAASVLLPLFGCLWAVYQIAIIMYFLLSALSVKAEASFMTNFMFHLLIASRLLVTMKPLNPFILCCSFFLNFFLSMIQIIFLSVCKECTTAMDDLLRKLVLLTAIEGCLPFICICGLCLCSAPLLHFLISRMPALKRGIPLAEFEEKLYHSSYVDYNTKFITNAYHGYDKDWVTSTQELPTSCPICFDNFIDETQVTVLPCHSGHVFCKECIGNWFKNSNICPVCRANIQEFINPLENVNEHNLLIGENNV